MEAADPFAGGVESTQDDPFADTPSENGGFSQADDPFAEATATAEPVPGVPVVDANGQPVAEAPVAETQVAAEAEPEAPSGQLPPAPSKLPDPTLPAEDSKAREQREAAEAQARREAEGSNPPVAAEGTSSEEPGEAAGSEPDPTSSIAAANESGSGEGPTTGSTSAAATAPTSGDGTEDEPQARDSETDTSGKVTKRAYRVLAPDGGGKWHEVTWYEDANGKMVERGSPGATKQNTCVVRGQAEALRIGWRAMGAPQDGCKLVAVSGANFRVRHVGPEVKPEPRVKLAIR